MNKDQYALLDPAYEIAMHESFEYPRAIPYLGYDRLPIGTKLYTAEVIHAAVAAEREACAKACDEAKAKSRNHLFRSGLSIAAGAIRARGGQS